MATRTMGFAIADEDRVLLDELVASFGDGNRSEFLRVAMRRMRRDLLAERLQQIQTQARDELAGRILTSERVRVWNGSASAILPVADLTRAVAFYRDLGFAVEIAGVGGYAFVESGGVRFHLSQSDGFDPFVHAAMVYLYVDDVDAVHASVALDDAAALSHDELVRRWQHGESMARMGPVRDEPWGMREFSFADPDNNLVRVGKPLAVSGGPY